MAEGLAVRERGGRGAGDQSIASPAPTIVLPQITMGSYVAARGGEQMGFLYTVTDKKQIGRPPGSTHTERLQIRAPAELLHRIDEWRAQQRPIPTRSEAFRRLAEAALDHIQRDGEPLRE